MLGTFARSALGGAEMNVIQMEDVGVYLGGKPILQHLNLTVARGDFVAVVGPSGCGKSTLLNLLAGFLQPTQGVLKVEGQPLLGPSSRGLCVFQESAVFPWLTVEQNVGFGLPSSPQRAARVRACLAQVGLLDHAGAWPQALSGGQRQRLQLARALAPAPSILYMDEPFGALDWFTRHQLRHDLLQIWQADRPTILFVTHDLDEAIQMAERIVVLGGSGIRAVLPVNLPRPRDPGDPAWVTRRNQILSEWFSEVVSSG